MEVDELRIFYRWRCCMDVGHFLVLLIARTVVDLVCSLSRRWTRKWFSTIASAANQINDGTGY